MSVERAKELMWGIQVREAREYFEALGRIERVFVNGAEIMPWHIDSMLVEIIRDRPRLEGYTISRIDGICTLRVAMRPTERKRRTA